MNALHWEKRKSDTQPQKLFIKLPNFQILEKGEREIRYLSKDSPAVRTRTESTFPWGEGEGEWRWINIFLTGTWRAGERENGGIGKWSRKTESGADDSDIPQPRRGGSNGPSLIDR
ncbi:hypothetical protein CDAR_535291 [Caerostris darwini]|uniref:Uncharacterized protein n=1 Tax=Caerostris darwini TaxID=1538125 RepID=A0AAV4QHK2_9ARAC|nr:hypothetical protein CDAR_535291 [Caerostris darwini]